MPGEVSPVQLADSSSAGADPTGPMTADMPLSSFSQNDPGLSNTSWPSAFSPGGGGGGAGGRGGGAGGAQTPGLPATSMDAFTLIPGGAPAGDPVPEPTAHDLFQLALALALWLAFRRLSA